MLVAWRARTDLGSSRNYPSVFANGEGMRLFGAAPFDTATVVYAKYCDGGSWTGALSNPPRVVGNATVYYRGRGLLEGLFDELFTRRGLDAAAEVLWAGCSAGGLTAYLHADWVAAQVRARGAPGARVVGLADAMFSLDHDDLGGDGHWPAFMRWVYNNMDPTGASGNEDCVREMAARHGSPPGNRSEGWRCMFGAAVAPYVQTPMFVLNSKYDTWQGKQIIGAAAYPGCADNIASAQCPANVKAFWAAYGRSMVAALDALPPRHGVYLHNCPSHCQTGLPTWDTDGVNGTSMGAAVAVWYTLAMRGRGAQEFAPRHIDRCDVTPCAGDVCNGQPT